MWKLTITQKIKSTVTDMMLDNNVEFVGNDIGELTVIIDRLSKHTGAIETSYKLEKAGGKNE